MSLVARAERDIRRVAFACIVALAVALPALGQSGGDEHWVATWATALVVRPLPGPPAGAPPTAAAPAAPATPSGAAPPPPAGAPAAGGPPRPPPPVTVSNQTLRQIVHTSIGGERVRVVLSNVFGTAPLEIAAAAAGPRAQGAEVRPGEMRALTFGGRASASILPGAVLVSDPIALTVAPLSDLAVDLHIPGEIGIGASPVTTHNGASQTSYVSTSGNHVGRASLPVDREFGAWLLLARIEVA